MTPPKLQRIAADIWQARLPLPFALSSVNVYLLRGPQGWTIIDTGIHTPESEAAWRELFHMLNFTPAQITQIVLTHVHPDHFGMAGWLQHLAQEAGCMVPVLLSPLEDYQVDAVWRPGERNVENWLEANGMPDDFARKVGDYIGDTRAMTLPHPTTLTQIQPGTTLRLGERDFQLIDAPGHSDGQLLLYDAADRLLICGDQVLAMITPNIGLWPHTLPEPLRRFMESLQALRALDVRMALPGHRHLIEDWQGRIDELLIHHNQRLAHTLTLLAAGHQTPYAVAQHLFDTSNFTPHEWRFALAESLAHLDYLHHHGDIQRADDTARYSLS